MQLALDFTRDQFAAVQPQETLPTPRNATGEKAEAQDLVNAIKVLKQVETEQRAATALEKEALDRFPGFGCLASTYFP